MKNLKLFYISFILLIIFGSSAYAQNGIIKGRVYDVSSNEPVMFATVAIEGSTSAATTDESGNYEIAGLTPGFYNITVAYLGYKNQTAFEVQVTNSKPAVADFAMEEEAEVVETVVVTANNQFKKPDESPVSLQTIGTAEIQRNPGGNRDISKVIRVLPGVTSVASFRNDLIIRGGAPNENRFFLDDVEVPNINHFATQGASGGPNGLLNVDLIREVDFYSGAFPANRGNSLSSVFNFYQKNGRDDRIGFTATLGSSDLAISLEGPLDKKKTTTFFVSARQSYLQFLFQALELPFLPTYNDFQFKVRSKIGEKHEFYVTGLGAIDRFKLNLKANETPEQRYLLANLPINNQWNYTLGAVYKYYHKTGFVTAVLSRNMLNNDVFKYIDNDETKERFIDYNSQEVENKARVEHTLRFVGFKLNYGVGYEFVRYTNNSKTFQLVNGTAVPLEFDSKLNFHKYYLFAQLSRKFFSDRFAVSAGVRMDGNSYSKTMANPLRTVSPRLSMSVVLAENLSFNVNGGMYYQTPAYTALGYRENGELVNRDRLDFIRGVHAVAGLEYVTKYNTKISVEGFFKTYDRYPFLLNEQISLANFGAGFGVVGNAPVDSRGKGRTYGMELLVQQRLYKGFYGILAYTLGWSEFEDKNGDYRPSSWESRHIINIAVGKTFKTMNEDIRRRINERRTAAGREAITRKLTAQTFDIGMNIRSQSGLPYTPFDTTASALTANWNVFGTGLRDYDLLNSQRAGWLCSLDMRLDYKWFFPKWSFNLYFDIQNIPGMATGVPELILDQGEDGNQPVTIYNPGMPNESYKLKTVTASVGTIVPSIGIIVQY